MIQGASEPKHRQPLSKRIGQLAGISAAIFMIASFSYTLGNFNARDTISRPDMSWALGSVAAIKISDLSISLEHAANVIRERNPEASDAALGRAYDYLTRLMAAAVEMHVAKGNPLQPEFTDWMSDYRKFLGDSPDAIYLTAPIDAEMEYELAINIGSADYIGFVVYDRNPITGWNRVADSTRIVPHADKSAFYIRLTATPGEGTVQTSGTRTGSENTLSNDSQDDISDIPMQGTDSQTEPLELHLSASSHMVMVREYFFDSENRQPSKLRINRLTSHADPAAESAKNSAPSEQDTTPFETRAENAVNFFNQTWQGSLALADALKETTNTFNRPATVSPDFVGIFYPTPDNDYHGGSFSLASGEALVIEGEVPAAAFWSITLQDHWMQSIEINGRSASLNGSKITNRQGHYRVWISDTPPPAGEDWLKTGGESEGLVAIRYLLSDNAIAPTARLHTLADALDMKSWDE